MPRRARGLSAARFRSESPGHVLPAKTRSALVEQAQRGRRRGGEPGHSLQDRNRQQLYELAKEKEIPGRSRMGKAELIRALRKAS